MPVFPTISLPDRDESWPESWLMSHAFDELELATELHSCRDPGYLRGYRQRVALALKLVTDHAPLGAEVLDVAAAQGNLTIALTKLGYRVTWNDLRADLAGYVRLKLGAQQVRFCPGNVLDLDAGDFDLVLATEVIEHVAHPDHFLRRLGELVRPGGHVIVTTPNGRFLRNPLPRFSDVTDPSVFEGGQFKPDADGHIFLMHPDELDPLGRGAGLDLIRAELCTSFIGRGWIGTDILTRCLSEPIIAAVDAAVSRFPAGMRERLMTHQAAVFRRPG